MKINEARNTIVQFQNWMRAADKMMEVVEHATQLEQQAKEADRRCSELATAIKQLEDTERKQKEALDALNEEHRSRKLAVEHETKRIEERARKARLEAHQQVEQAEIEVAQKIEKLQAKAKSVEDECNKRERTARAEAAKADKDLRALRKRLGVT